jgi:hypothetical protein
MLRTFPGSALRAAPARSACEPPGTDGLSDRELECFASVVEDDAQVLVVRLLGHHPLRLGARPDDKSPRPGGHHRQGDQKSPAVASIRAGR